MNKHCRRSEELSAYLDDELDGKSRLKFEMHLGSCFACKQMLQELRGLQRCFQTLPQQEIGFDITSGVLAAAGRSASPTARAWPRLRLWQLLPVSFTAAATISLGVFLGTSLSGPQDTVPAAPTLAMFDPIPPGGLCIGFAECFPKGKI